MNELINQVAQKTGLPPETAAVAVNTVLAFLKERLPAPIAQQLDSVAGGSGGQGSGGPLGGLGGLLGR